MPPPTTHKPHQSATFSECIGSFCNSSGWSSLKNRQFCLFIEPKISFVAEHNFSIKNIRLTFEEFIQVASIVAPAVFWKASHLNPIAANGDKPIIEGHHYHWPIQLRYFLQLTLYVNVLFNVQQCKFGAKFSHYSSQILFLTIKWKKREMNFPNRARILITKFNDLQAFSFERWFMVK